MAVIAVEGQDVRERLARVGLEPPAAGGMALVRPCVRGEILDEAAEFFRLEEEDLQEEDDYHEAMMNMQRVAA